jgi:hypothetical protein
VTRYNRVMQQLLGAMAATRELRDGVEAEL